jgi:hypothetical protein
MEPKTLDPKTALTLLQAAEQLPEDATLKVIVDTQAERMRQAAKILNLEWNGAYNENHVKAIALALGNARELLSKPEAAAAESAG